MADSFKIDFLAHGKAESGDLIVFVGDDLQPSAAVAKQIGPKTVELIARAASAENFKGKAKSVMTLVVPAGLPVDRLIVVGVGGEKDRASLDFAQLGGLIAGKVNGKLATAVLDLPGIDVTPEAVADVALGAQLRRYRFDRYKTKKDENGAKGASRLVLTVADPAAVKKVAKAREGIQQGVIIARDLVNEPPNVLGPQEFAARAEALAKLGVEVEILDDKAMRKLGMGALLGVAQGSVRGGRVAIMRWNGGKPKDSPVAFIGKGVVFDTGGISIKPGAGMEDMKGDMAGAACVVGLMHALASRKAKANVVGAIGLVENMPDGNAQRPGDIVTTMSGQTIEIINTDAEGRLVLADVLWYVQDRFKPKFMIDLATLTGAIMVALAQEYAGLFSNNDELAERLTAAGQATGERVWRMPLGPEFDKMIDSKFADMKNSAGRFGGSSTAAALLQRFVNDVPWAHLDIAGTAMGSPQNEINKGWASGWGVRLLDRLVRDHYEA
ncbi:leucyl aminopeptidase [Microvirga aerilata]|jgi:leucyl aminopeptidase|uniref:Probable cytosol aminopeptidase n=1 Tax=Microvirga aerilata TaxID=670292 RepID=A0A937D075_9HYPH|nr:leucyl aminopeptidase [Microvirga aerilata]MBL0402720.1 leucyl aminopeptidase [Microvirga aerilata]